MTLVKGLVLFAFFYTCAWLGWFTLLTAAQFTLLTDYFIEGLSGGSGLPFLIHVFAAGTAIASTWFLRALDHFNWF
jgi:hypothetical protein